MPSGCTWVIGSRSPPAITDTVLAPLRRARITVRSPRGCAPRIACGSWVSPATTLFIVRWSAASPGTAEAGAAAAGAEAGCAESGCPETDCPETDCPETDCPGADCPEADCPEVDCCPITEGS